MEDDNSKIAILTGLILCFAVLNNGSFTPFSKQLVAILLTFLFIIAWKKFLTSKRRWINFHPLTLAVAGLGIASLIALATAPNRDAVLQTTSLYLISFLFILLISNLSLAAYETIFRIMYIAVFSIAAISLFAKCSLPIPGWYTIEPGSTRAAISGPFHYANTMGIVLAAFWISGPFLTQKPLAVEAEIKHYPFDLIQAVVISAAMLTLSWGTFLATMAGLGYYVIKMGWSTVNDYFTRSFVWGLLVAVAAHLFKLPGLVFVTGMLYLFGYPLTVFLSNHKRVIFPLAIITIIALVWRFNLITHIPPLSTHTASDRIAYWQTALRIFIDNPWGIGGGGWEDLYPRYQQFAFHTKAVHNGYLQLAMETGIPGLIVIAAIIFYGFYRVIISFSAKPRLYSPFTAAAIVLVAHAAIDFDWSFMSAWLITLYFLHIPLQEKPVVLTQALLKRGKMLISVCFLYYSLIPVYSLQDGG